MRADTTSLQKAMFMWLIVGLKNYNKYSGNDSYQYEWSLWDNMPVRFGTKMEITYTLGLKMAR